MSISNAELTLHPLPNDQRDITEGREGPPNMRPDHRYTLAAADSYHLKPRLYCCIEILRPHPRRRGTARYPSFHTLWHPRNIVPCILDISQRDEGHLLVARSSAFYCRAWCGVYAAFAILFRCE